MRRRFSIARSLSCDLPRLWRCFEHPEVFLTQVPPLRTAKILAQEADVSVLEIEYEGAKDPLTLELVVSGPSKLVFYQVDRLRGQGVEGEISLTEAETGGTTLEIEVVLPFGLIRFTPAGAVINSLNAAVEILETTMKTQPIKVAAGVPKKLLEVTREDGIIKVWLRGHTYTLPERQET